MKRMSKENALAWLTGQRDYGLSAQRDYGLSAHALGDSYSDRPVDDDLDFGEDLLRVDTDGGEGDGAPISKVFLVTVGDEEFYFRITGVYSSWGDTTWDETFEIVEPREVVVTRYFPV